MGIRVYKPTSAARRFMSVLTFEEITKKKPEKSLTEHLKKHSGRNNQGKITVRQQGGGNKKTYRIIDFRATSPPGSPRSSTIRTGPRSSRC